MVPKYNPARTFTPEGSVGIGGTYMCIYPMDSPGGAAPHLRYTHPHVNLNCLLSGSCLSCMAGASRYFNSKVGGTLYVHQRSIAFAHMASYIANVNVHCVGDQSATPRKRAGYQLVGRTLPIWNTFGRVGPFTPQAPWLLHYFDQVPPPIYP